MAEPIRWGIIGTGSIAKNFATGLRALPDARLVAVGSRSQATAEVFGEQFNVPQRYASYEALANSPDVDVIYVATPHPFHGENSILCLEAGKAVLCEKPFTINAGQAEQVIACARARKLFLMEAMWTKFFPIMGKVRALITQESIGEVRMLTVDFGFRSGWNPEGRLLNPALGGGSLLDVGVYCAALSFMVFGHPAELAGFGHLGETGVDEQAAWVFRYEGGGLALCSSAVRTSTPQEAVINGTEGRICIHSPWWKPTKMTVSVEGKEPERVEFPLEGNGMNYEAAAVMECLREGLLEHHIMPLDETLQIMRTMDTLRTQWGLSYPME